jgi:hypothetical protein
MPGGWIAVFVRAAASGTQERVAFRLEMAQSAILQIATRCDSPVTKRSM